MIVIEIFCIKHMENDVNLWIRCVFLPVTRRSYDQQPKNPGLCHVHKNTVVGECKGLLPPAPRNGQPKNLGLANCDGKFTPEEYITGKFDGKHLGFWVGDFAAFFFGWSGGRGRSFFFWVEMPIFIGDELHFSELSPSQIEFFSRLI